MFGLALVSLILGLAGYAVSESLQGDAARHRSKLTQLANKIYSKIGTNNIILDKLYQAYQKRDSSLVNAIITNAGFGPAVIALRKEAEKNTKDYQNTKGTIEKENIDLTNKYNQANNAMANAGTFAGNVVANQTVNQLDQAINGGLNETK